MPALSPHGRDGGRRLHAIAPQGLEDGDQDAVAGIGRQARPCGSHKAARVAWRVALGGGPTFSRVRSREFGSYIAHYPFARSLGNQVFPGLFAFLASADESR